MTNTWIEKITGSLEEKRQYREYRARMRTLPEPYRKAVAGIDRYLMYAGGITDGSTIIRMLNDLADLFERAAADGTPVRAIVGVTPAEFVDDFVRSYEGASWLSKERDRLEATIAAAEALEQGADLEGS